MAQIENRTKAHMVFSVLGEKTRKKSYRTVVPPAKAGDAPQVVDHEVEEVSEGPVKTITVPPSLVGSRGLLDLDRNDLKQLKKQDDFMNFVKSGDIVILEH